MNYILWLASWYPNKTDEFTGDFIERHARAVSQYEMVIVIFVGKDTSLSPGQTKIDKTESQNLTVYKAHYGSSSIKGLEKLLSGRKYFSLQKRIFSSIIQQFGKPSLVHVHVALKAGMFALYLKRKFHINYIVSEHWSGYYPESPNYIYKAGGLKLRLLKSVLQNARLVMPVAKRLASAIQEISAVSFVIVPNVVDTNLFFYKPPSQQVFRFIHPSSLNYFKNPACIIRAAKMLADEGLQFELKMVGGDDPSLIELAKTSGLLNKYVFFKGVISYPEVAIEMQQSSALVMFSRFESLPCVILEALCCGVPVISSDVGGIKEVVSEENGILVASESELQLKDAMKKMLLEYATFVRKEIALNASSKFNYEVVGKQIVNIYNKILDTSIRGL